MGQQQLLLIILGVIIVGIAVAVGITMFQDNAVNAAKDAVVTDLVQLASKAQQFYRKPASLGGGGNSFVALTAGVDAAGGMAQLVSSQFAFNDNGLYVISTAGTATTVIFTGTSKTQDANGDYPTVTMTVTATGYTLGTWSTTATAPTNSYTY